VTSEFLPVTPNHYPVRGCAVGEQRRLLSVRLHLRVYVYCSAVSAGVTALGQPAFDCVDPRQRVASRTGGGGVCITGCANAVHGCAAGENSGVGQRGVRALLHVLLLSAAPSVRALVVCSITLGEAVAYAPAPRGNMRGPDMRFKQAEGPLLAFNSGRHAALKLCHVSPKMSTVCLL
jgi:hypothetical protein